MEPTTTGIVVVGAGVGLALGGQWAWNHFMHPDSANDSLLTRATGTVATATRRVLDPACTGVGVTVGFPVIVGVNNAMSDGPPTNNSMTALQQIASEEMGSDNAGDVSLAHLSCECMTGNLTVACSSCSLFNIHHPGCGNPTIITPRSPQGKPMFYRGTDRLIDFLSGEPNQIEGFRASFRHYKAYIERHSPGIVRVMSERNFDEYQRRIAAMNYAAMYTNSVVGNTVRDPFIRRRWERLVAAGLVAHST